MRCRQRPCEVYTRGHVFLAVVGERRVGSVRCRVLEDGRGCVQRLSVLPPYRRRGIATLLMQAAEERRRHAGVSMIPSAGLAAAVLGQRGRGATAPSTTRRRSRTVCARPGPAASGCRRRAGAYPIGSAALGLHPQSLGMILLGVNGPRFARTCRPPPSTTTRRSSQEPGRAAGDAHCERRPIPGPPRRRPVLYSVRRHAGGGKWAM